MLKEGDLAVVNTDDGRFYKGCEVEVLLNITDLAKKMNDNEPYYVKTKDGQCTAWYAEDDLVKVEG